MSTTVTSSPPRGQAASRGRAAGAQAPRPRRRWLGLPRASTTPGKLWLVRVEAGIIVLVLLMAVGCAWGLTVRLTEYR